MRASHLRKVFYSQEEKTRVAPLHLDRAITGNEIVDAASFSGLCRRHYLSLFISVVLLRYI